MNEVTNVPLFLAYVIICLGAISILLYLIIGLIVFNQKKGNDNIVYSSEFIENFGSKNALNLLAEVKRDILEKRNEFWFGSGQILVIVLIITVLTVLLLLDKISPEAGLPILSGISGFAIAKTIDVSRRRNSSE